MFRRLAGAAIALLLFLIGAAAAASLGGVSGSTLGADTSLVASCDTDGVTATIAPVYSSTNSRYEVATVTVGGIAAACVGKTVSVTVSDGAGTSLGTGSLAVAGVSAAVTIPAGAAVSSVVSVAVVIS